MCISEEQFGFMKGKSTTDAIFCAAAAARKMQRSNDSKIYTVCSLIWKKHTTKSQGKNRIGVPGTRGYQRSALDWRRTCTISAKLY